MIHKQDVYVVYVPDVVVLQNVDSSVMVCELDTDKSTVDGALDTL